jgi:hypothetical protein
MFGNFARGPMKWHTDYYDEANGQAFYHGGTPGLEPGDKLLPPSETGVKSFIEVLACYGINRFNRLARTSAFLKKHTGQDHWAEDKVYLCGDDTYDDARSYAGLYSFADFRQGLGTVYLAEPGGQWSRLRMGNGYCDRIECDYATVIEVVETNVTYVNREHADILTMLHMLNKVYRTSPERIDG